MEKCQIGLGRGGERKCVWGGGEVVALLAWAVARSGLPWGGKERAKSSFSAVSLGEQKGVIVSFFLTEATQEEKHSLKHCITAHFRKEAATHFSSAGEIFANE